MKKEKTIEAQVRDEMSKNWGMLSDSEKLERMRRIIHSLQRDVSELQHIETLLYNHAHVNNEVFTRKCGRPLFINRPMTDNVYF